MLVLHYLCDVEHIELLFLSEEECIFKESIVPRSVTDIRCETIEPVGRVDRLVVGVVQDRAGQRVE